MSFRRTSAASYISVFALLWGVDRCTNGQTPGGPQQTRSPAIKTNFIPDAQLSATEVSQVLALARACGISNAAEVRTFHFFPTDSKGISVKSVDRIEGRDSYFDTIHILKTGWTLAVPGKTARSIGDFWTAGSTHTTHLRSYKLNGEAIQLSIGENVEIAFADEAMTLIAEKQLRFLDDIFRVEFEKLRPLHPTSINRTDSQNSLPTYEIRLDGSSPRRMFVVIDKNVLVVTGWGGDPIP